MIFLILIFLNLLSFDVFSGPHPKKDMEVCTTRFKEITAHGVRDEHGKILSVKSVDSNTVIVDTNLLVSLGEVRSGKAEASREMTVQHFADYLKKIKARSGEPELSTTKTTTYEMAYRDQKIPSQTSVVKVSQYKQQDYDHIMSELKTAQVGGANQESFNAQNDRKIVVEVLFSERVSSKVVPKFATRDSGIVIPLCLKNPQCLAIFGNSSSTSIVDMITPANYRLIRQKFPYGFPFEIKDKGDVVRSMQVLPL